MAWRMYALYRVPYSCSCFVLFLSDLDVCLDGFNCSRWVSRCMNVCGVMSGCVLALIQVRVTAEMKHPPPAFSFQFHVFFDPRNVLRK